MIWSLTEPKNSDIIRLKVGSIYHYGIFVSNDEVIQFGANPASEGYRACNDLKVIVSNIGDFSLGGSIEVAEYDETELAKKYSPESIVKTARSRIGEGGYHILYNNCEHFVNECVFGEHKCYQVDTVRELFRNMPRLDLYIGEVPTRIDVSDIYPVERRQEILSCQNERVRCEKYAVWKLLECAAKGSLGLELKNLKLEKQKNGKWVCERFKFSLTHGNGLVAVALSHKPVGVDVERVDRVHLDIAKRVLCESELSELERSDEKEKYLAEKWTQKESEFKMGDGAVFSPSKILPVKSKSIYLEYGGGNYVLSVSGDDLARLKICHKPEAVRLLG